MVDPGDIVAGWIAVVFAGSLLYGWIGTPGMFEAMCKAAFPPMAQCFLMGFHFAITLHLLFRNRKLEEQIEKDRIEALAREMYKEKLLRKIHEEQIQGTETYWTEYYEEILEHCTCDSWASYVDHKQRECGEYDSDEYDSE